MTNRETANKKILQYINNNCPWAKCSLSSADKIYMDNVFEYKDLVAIMAILDEYFDED